MGKKWFIGKLLKKWLQRLMDSLYGGYIATK